MAEKQTKYCIVRLYFRKFHYEKFWKYATPRAKVIYNIFFLLAIHKYINI